MLCIISSVAGATWTLTQCGFGLSCCPQELRPSGLRAITRTNRLNGRTLSRISPIRRRVYSEKITYLSARFVCTKAERLLQSCPPMVTHVLPAVVGHTEINGKCC